MHFKNHTIELFGRILFATTFLVAIPPKIIKFKTVVIAIANRGISTTIAPFLLITAIICLFFGSLFLIYGKYRSGSSLLMLFLVPTTLIFHVHPFDPQSFFMNLGLIGALVIFYSKLNIGN